jgi:hypothetical protein
VRYTTIVRISEYPTAIAAASVAVAMPFATQTRMIAMLPVLLPVRNADLI